MQVLTKEFTSYNIKYKSLRKKKKKLQMNEHEKFLEQA